MDCEYCEIGHCEACDGLTPEGFSCDCSDAAHFGLFEGDDDDEYECFMEIGQQGERE